MDKRDEAENTVVQQMIALIRAGNSEQRIFQFVKATGADEQVIEALPEIYCLAQTKIRDEEAALQQKKVKQRKAIIIAIVAVAILDLGYWGLTQIISSDKPAVQSANQSTDKQAGQGTIQNPGSAQTQNPAQQQAAVDIKDTERKIAEDIAKQEEYKSNLQKEAAELEQRKKNEEIARLKEHNEQLQKELAELKQSKLAAEKARQEASQNVVAPQSQSSTQQQSADDPLLARAVQCKLNDCIPIMLDGVNPRKPEVIEAAASRIDGFAKPQRGDRKTARALNERGLNEFKNSNYASAVDILKQAATADPADVEIQSNLAFVALRADRSQIALEAVSVALKINPRRTSSWVSLSEFFILSAKNTAATRAMLLAYEFSANKEKSLAFFEDKANTAERPEMRPVYKEVLEMIKAGDMD
jgi:hypothetical protein